LRPTLVRVTIVAARCYRPSHGCFSLERHEHHGLSEKHCQTDSFVHR
jgi:hypothetical protein